MARRLAQAIKGVINSQVDGDEATSGGQSVLKYYTRAHYWYLYTYRQNSLVIISVTSVESDSGWRHDSHN